MWLNEIRSFTILAGRLGREQGPTDSKDEPCIAQSSLDIVCFASPSQPPAPRCPDSLSGGRTCSRVPVALGASFMVKPIFPSSLETSPSMLRRYWDPSPPPPPSMTVLLCYRGVLSCDRENEGRSSRTSRKKACNNARKLLCNMYVSNPKEHNKTTH